MPNRFEKLDARVIGGRNSDQIYRKAQVLAKAAAMSVSGYLRFIVNKQYELKYGDIPATLLQKDYITTREIAKDLNISTTTAKRMIRRKTFGDIYTSKRNGDGQQSYQVPKNKYIAWKNNRFIVPHDHLDLDLDYEKNYLKDLKHE